MNNNRIINAVIACGIAIVLVGAWFLGVSPILDQVRAADDQTQTLQSANAASAARLANLKKQFENMGALQTQLQKLQDSIPSGADIPKFLAEINALSAASGVTLTSLSANEALAYVAPGAAAAAPATPATPDSSASGATATPGASNVPATDPSTGLIAIPVAVRVSGPYAQIMAFVGALQTGARLLLVNNVSLGASTDGLVSVEITGNIYALPLPAGVAASPTPTPSATPSPTPSPSSTGSPSPSETPSPSQSPSPQASNG